MFARSRACIPPESRRLCKILLGKQLSDSHQPSVIRLDKISISWFRQLEFFCVILFGRRSSQMSEVREVTLEKKGCKTATKKSNK